jgi:hypothetical protein
VFPAVVFARLRVPWGTVRVGAVAGWPLVAIVFVFAVGAAVVGIVVESGGGRMRHPNVRVGEFEGMAEG